MDINELNEITGLDNTEKDSVIPASDTEKQQEGEHKCKKCSYSTDNKGDLLVHYRKEHPKEKIDDGSVAEPKTKKEKYETDIASIPSDYDRLASLLKSFGVPNWAGVIEGIKLYDIRDINALKDLLRNVSTPQGKSEAIARIWSEMQGLKPISLQSNNVSAAPEDTGYVDWLKKRERLAYIKMMEKEAGSDTNSNNSSELSRQIADMQRSFEAKLAEQERKYNEALEKQRQQSEFQALKERHEMEMKQVQEELKRQKEETKEQVEGLGGVLSKFFTEDQHKWELFQREQDYTKKLAELKEELRLSKPTTPAAESFRELRGMVQDIGGGLAGMAKDTTQTEKSLALANLLDRGVPYKDAYMSVHGRSPSQVDLRGSAQQEWQKMQQITMQPEPIQEAPKPEIPQEIVPPIKFNAGD